MIGQRNTAIRAFIDKAAVAAANKLICPSPVEKQNTLLATDDVFGKLITKLGTDIAAVAAFELLLHVNYLDRRQQHFVVPLAQSKIFVPAYLSRVSAFKVGCSRAQQQK